MSGCGLLVMRVIKPSNAQLTTDNPQLNKAMFKHYFEGIQNVEIYPIISLIIFFTFFLLMIIWLIKVNQGYIDKMKNMPLESDEELDLKSKNEQENYEHASS